MSEEKKKLAQLLRSRRWPIEDIVDRQHKQEELRALELKASIEKHAASITEGLDVTTKDAVVDAVTQVRAELEAERRLADRVLTQLPQGHGSGLDADKVDGLHADEVAVKAAEIAEARGGSMFGITDHGQLQGLADDDHEQYIHYDGRRAFTKYVDIHENTVPASPAANTLRLYVEDFKGFPFFSFCDATGMVRKLVRDSVFVAKNMTGSTIEAHRAVYASGSSEGVPTIAKARANAVATMPSVGVTLEAIADGAFGRVMQIGLVENVDTSAFAAGNVLYVSSTVAGLLVATAPLYPNIRQEIGTILMSDAVVGSVQVVARSMFNEGILDHGGMLGLADDDHTQYFHTDGTDAMTGNLDLAGNSLLTTNLELNELTAACWRIVDRGTTTLRDLMVRIIYPDSLQSNATILTVRPKGVTTGQVWFQTWNGAAWEALLTMIAQNGAGNAYVDIPQAGDITMLDQKMMKLGTYTDAQRPAAGTVGRVIFNTDDGMPNYDDGANWRDVNGNIT